MEGRVLTDGSAAPIPAATVTVDGREVRTASDGGFRFNALASGSYGLSVSTNGYHTATRQITVRDDRITRVTIRLEASTDGVVYRLDPISVSAVRGARLRVARGF